MIKVATPYLEMQRSALSGTGVGRYMEEFSKMSHRCNEISITKCKISKPRYLSNSLAYMVGGAFYDFSGFDIIHNLDFISFYPLRRGNSVWVSTVHDLQPLLYPELNDKAHSIMDKVWYKMLKIYLKIVLKSDYLLVDSSQTMNEAIKAGFPNKKIFLVHHGIADKFLTRIPKKQHHTGFKAGFISSFRFRKNVTFAVDAIKASSKEISLELYGKKSLEYSSLVLQAGNDRRITFKGFLPDKNIVSTYDSFDAFVYPTLHEGFGLPILEAQARGIPVIIYKAGKVPKEVRKYCFEASSPENMAEILERLYKNGYDDRLRDKATAYARSFTIDKMVKKTFDFYKKIVS